VASSCLEHSPPPRPASRTRGGPRGRARASPSDTAWAFC
jgi:hypothetical protein